MKTNFMLVNEYCICHWTVPPAPSARAALAGNRRGSRAPAAPRRQPTKPLGGKVLEQPWQALTSCAPVRASGQDRSSLESSPLLTFLLFFRDGSPRPSASAQGQGRAASGSVSCPGRAPARLHP